MSRGKKKYLQLLNKIKMVGVEKPEKNKHRSKENSCGNKFVYSSVFDLHISCWLCPLKLQRKRVAVKGFEVRGSRFKVLRSSFFVLRSSFIVLPSSFFSFGLLSSVFRLPHTSRLKPHASYLTPRLSVAASCLNLHRRIPPCHPGNLVWLHLNRLYCKFRHIE